MSERTDRELLELAAKAAGIDGKYFESEEGICIHTGIYRAGFDYYWNPLLSDSEALRLAVRLYLRVEPMHSYCVAYSGSVCAKQFSERADSDRYTATRRAIVRAAAEIGANMQS